eukprot:gene28878-32070_t
MPFDETKFRVSVETGGVDTVKDLGLPSFLNVMGTLARMDGDEPIPAAMKDHKIKDLLRYIDAPVGAAEAGQALYNYVWAYEDIPGEYAESVGAFINAVPDEDWSDIGRSIALYCEVFDSVSKPFVSKWFKKAVRANDEVDYTWININSKWVKKPANNKVRYTWTNDGSRWAKKPDNDEVKYTWINHETGVEPKIHTHVYERSAWTAARLGVGLSVDERRWKLCSSAMMRWKTKTQQAESARRIVDRVGANSPLFEELIRASCHPRRYLRNCVDERDTCVCFLLAARNNRDRKKSEVAVTKETVPESALAATECIEHLTDRVIVPQKDDQSFHRMRRIEHLTDRVIVPQKDDLSFHRMRQEAAQELVPVTGEPCPCHWAAKNLLQIKNHVVQTTKLSPFLGSAFEWLVNSNLPAQAPVYLKEFSAAHSEKRKSCYALEELPANTIIGAVAGGIVVPYHYSMCERCVYMTVDGQLVNYCMANSTEPGVWVNSATPDHSANVAYTWKHETPGAAFIKTLGKDIPQHEELLADLGKSTEWMDRGENEDGEILADQPEDPKLGWITWLGDGEKAAKQVKDIANFSALKIAELASTDPKAKAYIEQAGGFKVALKKARKEGASAGAGADTSGATTAKTSGMRGRAKAAEGSVDHTQFIQRIKEANRVDDQGKAGDASCVRTRDQIDTFENSKRKKTKISAA